MLTPIMARRRASTSLPQSDEQTASPELLPLRPCAGHAVRKRLVACVLAAAGVLGNGCVDLSKPWDKVKPTDARVGLDGGGKTDGAAGAPTGGSPGSGGATTSGRGGAGGTVDGASPPDTTTDAPFAATGGIAGSNAGGVDGGGGLAQGGTGGGDGAPLGGSGGVATGGAGGTSRVDGLGLDVADAPIGAELADGANRVEGATDEAAERAPDAPSERAPDSPADGPPDAPSDRAADAEPDGPPDTPADLASEVPDVAADGVSTVGLVAYYPCQGPGGASGTTLPDLSGHENHGIIAIGPAPTGGAAGTGGSGGTGGDPAFSFGSGKVGNALTLNGSAYAYVGLPAALLDGQQQMTVAAWIKVKSTAAFQRVFDFGTDTTNFMYLATANSDNTAARFRIASSAAAADGASSSQVLEGTQPVATGTWTHLALVLGPSGAAIYVDGALQASSADVTLRPVDLGSTTNNFIGRSEFPRDPYFDGQIDEYRIYSRALSAEEIAALAGS